MVCEGNRIVGKKQRCWKILAMGISCCLSVGLLWGCSDEAAEESKDTEQAEQECSSSLSQFAEAPEWAETREFTAADGNTFTLSVSASVEVPDVDAMSVIEVQETVIDQDFKKQLLDCFFEGEDIYYHDIAHMTRAELEEKIEEQEVLVQYAEEGLENIRETYDGSREEFDELTQEYQTGLDLSKEKLQALQEAYDGAGEEYTLAAELDSCNQFAAYKEGLLYWISFPEEGENPVVTIFPGELLEGHVQESFYVPEGLEGYEYISCHAQADVTGANQCSIALEDARRMADQLVTGAGRGSQILMAENQLVWKGWKEESAEVVDGYRFVYGTGVDGLVFREFGTYKDYVEDMYYEIPEGLYDLDDTMTVDVTDSGLIGITMWYPITVEKMTEQVELLPISVVQGIMRQEILEHTDRYIDNGKGGHIAFNALELIYFRVKDGDTAGAYSYVPTWRLSRKSEEGYDHPILVNAIDGSVIYLEDELAGTNSEAAS